MTRDQALQAQKDFCAAASEAGGKAYALPHFAPYDGYCSACKADIVTGFEDRWENSLITACPICHESYTD